MGILDFLQDRGALGQMVRNVCATYKTIKKQEPNVSDMERYLALTRIRYFQPQIPNRDLLIKKTIGTMYAFVDAKEPMGLYNYCRCVAYAEMDVEPSDIQTTTNMLKIIKSEGFSYEEAYGEVYTEESFERALREYGFLSD